MITEYRWEHFHPDDIINLEKKFDNVYEFTVGVTEGFSIKIKVNLLINRTLDHGISAYYFDIYIPGETEGSYVKPTNMQIALTSYQLAFRECFKESWHTWHNFYHIKVDTKKHYVIVERFVFAQFVNWLVSLGRTFPEFLKLVNDKILNIQLEADRYNNLPEMPDLSNSEWDLV